MQGLKKSGVAWALTILVVLAATVGGCCRSVSQQAAKVQAMFYDGVDGSGYGVQNDLDDRQEYAGFLVKIAAKYTGAEEESAAVQQALSQYRADASVSEKYAEDRQLGDAVTALGLAMQQLPLSAQDAQYCSGYLASFSSSGMTMAREAENYNAQVRSFQRTVLGGTIAKVVGTVLPLAEVEAFA